MMSSRIPMSGSAVVVAVDWSLEGNGRNEISPEPAKQALAARRAILAVLNSMIAEAADPWCTVKAQDIQVLCLAKSFGRPLCEPGQGAVGS